MSDLIGFESPKIDWTPGPDLPQRFKRFRQKCELLFDGPLKARTNEQRCRYVLLWTVDYGLDLFNTWNLSSEEQNKLDEYWKRFEEHVKPQSNHILNRFYLRNLRQNGRPLDDFLTEAKLLIQNSGYLSTLHDELLRDALVFGVDSDIVRKKCIAEGNDLTLKKAREIARTDEATRLQLKAMTSEADTTHVNSLHRAKGNAKPKQRGQRDNKARKQRNDKHLCNRCGNESHTGDNKCPASGVECHYCHKRGHFSKVCRKRNQVHEVQNHTAGKQENNSDLSDDDMFLESLEVDSINNNNRSKVITTVEVTAKPYHKKTTPIVCKIDTGAETNVISKTEFDKIIASPSDKALGPPQILTAYGGQKIECMGTCQLFIHHKDGIKDVTFTVTNVQGTAMLGCKTSEELGFVTINCSIENTPPLTKETLLSSYPDRFEGLGAFKDMKPYHIMLDPAAEPVIHPPRSVPVHLKDLYRKELDDMLNLGVITPVDRPTDWVNSIVLSEKKNDKGEVTKLRVCLDPRDLNKWAKREHYRSKTVDEVVTELNDAKFFTIVDTKKGYWHVPLDEESSYLTTFSTPFGRYRFKRLPFGLVVSQDVFQKQLDTAFEGLDGVTGIADDTFVYGSSEVEHDRNLTKLMERAQQKGVVFNEDKVQFKCKKVSFFGHTWTPQGIKPDNKKVSAIIDMKPPEDTKSLQSFLGLVNYLTRYSGRLATLSAPLRDLTKKDTAYSWGPEHDRAFTEVKKEVSSLGVLRYFDPHAETVIETDASLKGLGAVLLQDGKPVCYASKALTETEQRYSNIEREALGVIWGLERFHYFIYGKSCTIHTDHKPLEMIFKKKLSNCPARLQRFVLRALKYNVTVKYVKGAEVSIADALSRVSPQPAPPEGEFPQLDIHQITKNLPASPIKLQQIRNETANDPTLSKLREVIHEGWPATREKCHKALHNYWNFREELTIEDGLILKQERIVMPSTLRRGALNTIHHGHLGQEKCLLRARSAVFWPGITKDVTNLVQNCATCQAHQRKQQKQQILQPEPPCYPWQILSSDLFEFKGNQYLLISDKYSKFPIIRKLTSTTSRAIINHLKSIFAEHGIPERLTTDNGPQYASQEFHDFMQTNGVEHVTSSPMTDSREYPQEV